MNTGTGSVRRLADFIDAIKYGDELADENGEKPYDYCLIYCAPSFTTASIAVIAASDEVIIPIKIDGFGF